MTLRFHPDAAAELEAAVSWYRNEEPRAAVRFSDEVRRRAYQAARFPLSGPQQRGFEARLDVRGFVLRGFPYWLVTARVRDERIVVAMAHTSREPGYWRTRVG